MVDFVAEAEALDVELKKFRQTVEGGEGAAQHEAVPQFQTVVDTAELLAKEADCAWLRFSAEQRQGYIRLAGLLVVATQALKKAGG